jgi:hypothetical protein
MLQTRSDIPNIKGEWLSPRSIVGGPPLCWGTRRVRHFGEHAVGGMLCVLIRRAHEYGFLLPRREKARMRGHSNWHPHLCPLPSKGEEGRPRGVDFNATADGQTALSGSQIKPPALPEVHDSVNPTSVRGELSRTMNGIFTQPDECDESKVFKPPDRRAASSSACSCPRCV